MRTRGRLIAAIGAVALTLIIAVTAIVAGGPLRALAAPATPTAPSRTGGMTGGGAPDFAWLAMSGANGSFAAAPGQGGDIQARCQAFVTGMAANLNVTTDQFQSAFKKTVLQQIDAAEAAGTLTATQAQAARDRINNATGSLCDNLGQLAGMGGGPAGFAAGGMGGAALQGDVLNAAATYFNVSADQLKQDLQAAGSLQGVAAKYGKDDAAGKAGLEGALEGALKGALTTRGLSADMVDQAVNLFKQNFDRLYTAPLGATGNGGGGPMRGPFGPGHAFPGGQGGPHFGGTPSATPTR